jgi:hypothetical protein
MQGRSGLTGDEGGMHLAVTVKELDVGSLFPGRLT